MGQMNCPLTSGNARLEERCGPLLTNDPRFSLIPNLSVTLRVRSVSPDTSARVSATILP